MGPATFAKLEQRVGRVAMARIANALLVPEGGAGVPVVFSRPVELAPLGEAGMRMQRAVATGLASDLGPDVQRDTACTVYHDEQMVIPAGDYVVRDRDDHTEPGFARLDLELAAA